MSNPTRRLWPPLTVGALGLLVVLAAAGSGLSNVRADASPSPSSPNPPGISKVSSGLRPATCDASLSLDAPGTALGSVARTRLSSVLVPKGPAYMTVCRYAGLNQRIRAGILERSRVVTGRALARFVDFVDQRWEVIARNSIYSCPDDQGSVDILRFVYPTGPQVALSVDISGCTFASNGIETVWGSAIGQRLTQWVGVDSGF
jgi:hypothetical protein